MTMSPNTEVDVMLANSNDFKETQPAGTSRVSEALLGFEPKIYCLCFLTFFAIILQFYSSWVLESKKKVQKELKGYILRSTDEPVTFLCINRSGSMTYSTVFSASGLNHCVRGLTAPEHTTGCLLFVLNIKL